MKIKKIADILEADVLACSDKCETAEVMFACGSDMMSDVLAFVKEKALLLTGICNPQVVRTAEMMDIPCIAFVRGKRPDAMVISLAEEKGIILLATKYTMYKSCGMLYAEGLAGN